MIVAGRLGKTTVMAARVVWLVGTGQVAPEQVLGLTFTNKAAGELAERVRKALVKAA
ncbi:UvrD-helicase domain-containing protein [Streptomyces sp. INA 01156]